MAYLDDLTKKRIFSAMKAVCHRSRPVSAYLFGSRVEGGADKWSDYDLAVFIEGAEKWDITKLARFCSEIQKEAGDDIELHIFPASKSQKPEPASFAAHIISHGISLPLEELPV